MAEIPPFAFWADGVILTTISVSGLVGTIMSIFVLLKPRIRDFFSSFLTALGIFDSIFLLLAIVQIGITNISSWYGNYVAVHFISYTHGALHIARTGSVYVTMSVTLERYFAIVYPLKHFTIKKYLLPTTVLFAIAYNLPKFFEMEKFVFPYINETAIRKTALRKNPIYDQVYTFWSKVIVMEFVPYVTIIVLNSFIVIKIYESLKFRGRFDRTGTGNHSEVGDRSRAIEEANGLKRDKEILQLRVLRPRARSDANETSLLPREELQRRRPSALEVPHHKSERRLSSEQINRQASSSLAIDRFQNSPCVSRSPSMVVTFPASTAPQRVISANKNVVHDREISLAITLVLISLLFVICQSFKLIPDIYEILYCNHSLSTSPNSHCQTSEFIETVISMSNLLICFNSAANFLLYMLRGKKFRDAFCQTYFGLVCKWCTRPNRNPDSPMMSSSAVNNQIVRRPTQAMPSNLLAPPTVISDSRSSPRPSSDRQEASGYRSLLGTRNESVTNFTTTSFVEGDTLLTVHLGDES